ncbi:MAG: dipicolinate synthase subunit B [Firmicutes bacterium]|nr:dipicolinate synthase subunit B [Bacillota bacterium]
MKKLNIAFAMCASFCCIRKTLDEVKKLSKKYNILPIMSSNLLNTDTRFGKSKDIKIEFETICSKKIISSIVEAEPIGPKLMADVMVICPCTGNTLAKLCRSITDTQVTMAAKSHLRVQRPLVIGFASNDALGSSAKNIAQALNSKNIYFVPMSQDDPINKPNSIVANFEKLDETIIYALENKQIQPVLC